MKKILFVCLILLLVTPTLVLAAKQGTPEEAKAMVIASSEYFKANGLEKTIEVIADGSKFKDGDLYVFLLNYKTGMMRAHGANKVLVGKNVMDLQDADGVLIVPEFKKVVETKGEGWVDYKWPNPVTRKIEKKTTYVKKLNEELFIGCGAYIN